MPQTAVPDNWALLKYLGPIVHGVPSAISEEHSQRWPRHVILMYGPDCIAAQIQSYREPFRVRHIVKILFPGLRNTVFLEAIWSTIPTLHKVIGTNGNQAGSSQVAWPSVVP